jgi:hypothetical protein
LPIVEVSVRLVITKRYVRGAEPNARPQAMNFEWTRPEQKGITK